MTRLAQDAERAVVEAKDDRGGVDVVAPGEDREAADRTGGVDLFDRSTGHPAQGVEVVDRRIAEQPAGRGDVVVGWRLVIMRDQPNQVERAQLTGLEEAPGLGDGGIEPPLKPHLDRHAASLDVIDELDRLVEVGGQWLLAEHGNAAVDRLPNETSVRVG